jgi:hypothetical protein
MVEYASLYPEYKCVWIGDSGQGMLGEAGEAGEAGGMKKTRTTRRMKRRGGQR